MVSGDARRSCPIDLWVTEGSKKVDALASKGACAVSLASVWEFKGKNEMGGAVFLADWDHIALKGRTVYLAFDSDVVTKAPVRQALERLLRIFIVEGQRF